MMLYLTIYSFIIGEWYALTTTQQPSMVLISVASICAFSCARVYPKYTYLTYSLVLMGAGTLGCLWATFFINQHISWKLPHELEKKSLRVKGIVSSMPIERALGTEFIFTLEAIKSKHWKGLPHPKIKLRLKKKTSLSVGDEWHFTVRLKRIHGSASLGAFDYELWSLHKGLAAAGYVLESPDPHKMTHYWYYHPLEQIRSYMAKKLEPLLPDIAHAAWLKALILGDRAEVAAEDWLILRATGTNHLMAVGGLHIGFIAGFIFVIANFLWSRPLKLNLYKPAKEVAQVAAIAIALIYSLLSGLGIPSQRAFLMLSVFSLTILLRKKVNPWLSWSLALWLVVANNPFNLLTDSMWLSFVTLAIIIYTMTGRLYAHNWWWRWGRVQWTIGLGLIPLSIALFQEFSISSFIANSIAIPWLGFLILPFCLLSSVCLLISPKLTAIWLWMGGKSLAMLWQCLTWLANLHCSTFAIAMPNAVVYCFCVIGTGVLLAPNGIAGRWSGWALFLPLFFHQVPKPPYTEYWLSMLDVGQGLSVAVQTQQHLLIYDAGPHFLTGLDMGEAVVSPFLRLQGYRSIDNLIISHGDNDHIGGAKALLQNFSVKKIQTSNIAKLKTPKTTRCLAGQHWVWEGVSFDFIYPFADTLTFNNDSSCVLRIDNGRVVTLLTGDIEQYAEWQLLMRTPEKLKANIMTAPHHGSKTSGDIDFLRAVRPNVVLIGSGYLNRYHFPHPSVLQGYQRVKTKPFNTADLGTIDIQTNQRAIAVTSHRQQLLKQWFR